MLIQVINSTHCQRLCHSSRKFSCLNPAAKNNCVTFPKFLLLLCSYLGFSLSALRGWDIWAVPGSPNSAGTKSKGLEWVPVVSGFCYKPAPFLKKSPEDWRLREKGKEQRPTKTPNISREMAAAQVDIVRVPPDKRLHRFILVAQHASDTYRDRKSEIRKRRGSGGRWEFKFSQLKI